MATLTLSLNEGYNAPQLGRALWASAPKGSTVMIEVGDADCFNSYLKVSTHPDEVMDRVRDALADGEVAVGPEWKDDGKSLYFYTTCGNGNIHYYYYGVPPQVHELFPHE